jgi:hypothetical protein
MGGTIMARYTLTITIVTDLDLLARDAYDAIEMAIMTDSAMLEVEVTDATVSRPSVRPGDAPAYDDDNEGDSPAGWRTVIMDGSDAVRDPSKLSRPRRPRSAR